MDHDILTILDNKGGMCKIISLCSVANSYVFVLRCFSGSADKSDGEDEQNSIMGAEAEVQGVSGASRPNLNLQELRSRQVLVPADKSRGADVQRPSGAS